MLPAHRGLRRRSPGPARSQAIEKPAGRQEERQGRQRQRLSLAIGPSDRVRGQWRHVPAHLADPRVAARRDPCRPRADGGHHQRGLPPALRRAGRRPLRLRDDHLAAAWSSATRPPCRCWSSTTPSRSGRCSSTAPTRSTSARPPRSSAREYGVAHIDLNFGCPVPKVTRKGGGGALPWKRRLLGQILEQAVRRRGAVRRAGHDEDPQGHRRRPPDLPRRGPDRRRSPAARRSRCTAGPWRRPTPGAPTGTRSRRWSTTSTSRCSATATSGRPPTRCGWSRRPAPPASSSAAAVWAGRGSSATSRRRSPASRSPRCRRSARSRR